ncbi:MAG: nicotinate-nucleotide adenylyltransferase [Thermogutta sp.]|nr:nicotinate-nucleotide adenylyltransferase [Thermogutta sp.]
MRIGIYGGTFDPIHFGHLLLAESCREQIPLDKVFFVPAGNPPHKRGTAVTPAVDRLAMLELAIFGEDAFASCRYEIDREEVSYTVDTVRWFRESRPEAELFLMMGADMWYDLPHWRDPREICRLATPVAVCRPGIPAPNPDRLLPLLPENGPIRNVLRVEMPAIGISSSEIRARVAAGKSIRFRVPRAVEAYIATHRLYR